MKTSSEAFPKVSVIIPNYNYSQYINQCIDSVLAQTYPNLEALFIDDGSTDESVNVVQEYGSKVKIIEQPNLGVNAARNRGITSATGEYIALCDSDDFWEPDKIAIQMKVILERKDLVLIGCGIFRHSYSSVSEIIPTNNGNIAQLFLKFPTKALLINSPSTTLFRRDLALRIGMFDESLRGNAEDWDFFRRYCQRGNVETIRLPLVHIREHEMNRSKINLSVHYVDNLKAINNAHLDEFYSWNYFRHIFFQWRFELQYIKSHLKNRNIFESIKHVIYFLKYVKSLT